MKGRGQASHFACDREGAGRGGVPNKNTIVRWPFFFYSGTRVTHPWTGSFLLAEVFFVCRRGMGWCDGGFFLIFSHRFLSEAFYGHVRVVKALIDARADLYVKNKDGRTAIHMAVKNWKT